VRIGTAAGPGEVRMEAIIGAVGLHDALSTASQIPAYAKSGHCALARANRDFGTDKNIRTKITVLDKSNCGSGLFLFKIADCVRTAFRPCAIGDPRGRVFVRAKSQLHSNGAGSEFSRHAFAAS